MDFEFPDKHRSVLAGIVSDTKGSYACDYPFDATERDLAANVQAALQQLGHEVSLSDAAAVWEAYSMHLQAGWLDGAETIKSAGECLSVYCADVGQQREPTSNEAAGIAWWNALTETERAKWLAQAGSAVPADAWAAYKRHPGAT